MSTPPPSSAVPEESKPIGTRLWRKEIGAGVTVAAGSIPNELSYGLLAMAPLGLAMEGRGILAAMLAGMLGTLVALSLGSRVGQIHGARPALALITSALIGHTLIKANWLPGIPHQDGALILMGLALAGAALLQLTTAAAGWGRFVRYIPYPVQAGFFNGVALLMLLGGLKLVFMQGGIWHLSPGPALVAAVIVLPGFVLQQRWPERPFLPVLLCVGALLHHVLAARGMAMGLTLGALAETRLSVDHLLHLPDALALHGPGDWLRVLGGSCVAIALVSALETLFAANRLDTLTHSRHDTRRELAAIGGANLALAAAGALPAAGAVSRANAAYAAGGRTRIPALCYALLIALLWLFGLDLLAMLPHATIGAGLVLLSAGVADRWSVHAVRDCLRSRTLPERRLMSNLAVSALVTLVAAFVGLLEAVSAGLVGAMFLFARAHSKSIVRRVVDGSVASSLQIRPAWQQIRLASQSTRYALVELEGLLFFGTAEELEEVIETRLAEARFIVLDCSRLIDIDLSAAQVLSRMAARLRIRHTRLALAGLDPAGARASFLASSGLTQVLPRKRWFANADAALEWAENQVLDSGTATRRLDSATTLRHLDVCAGMSADQAATLEGLMQRRLYVRGDVLFNAGDASDAMYVLQAGSVSILRAGDAGTPQIRIACLSAGLVVGEMGLIENQPRTADAVADTTVECLVLERTALELLQSDHPQIANLLYTNLARTLAQRLRDTTIRLHGYMRPH